MTPAERPDTPVDLPAPDQAAVLKELLASADGMQDHFDEVLDGSSALRPPADRLMSSEVLHRGRGARDHSRRPYVGVKTEPAELRGAVARREERS